MPIFRMKMHTFLAKKSTFEDFDELKIFKLFIVHK